MTEAEPSATTDEVPEDVTVVPEPEPVPAEQAQPGGGDGGKHHVRPGHHWRGGAA